MKKNIRTIAIVCLFLISMVTGVLIQNKTAQAAFNPSHVIEDSTYENTGTMNASQIDSFLNSMPQSCLSTNHGFTTPDPTGWSASVGTNHGYTFGGNVTAGTAIYHTAQIYHINPQVILSTLQYEQAVVTGSAGCHYNTPNPSNTYTCDLWRNGGSHTCTTACPYAGGCVTIAMSNQCDAGNCDATYEGFSLQLLSATWLERFGQERAYGLLTGYPGHDPGDENIYYGGPMTQGYRKRSASSSSIYYDGTYTVGGTTLTMTNGATAARYFYIPSISGNQSFYNTFLNWFGSPVNICGSDPYNSQSTGRRVIGDYTGDSRADPSVFRPSNGCWHIRAYGDVGFGQNGDIPVPGDYNGDGKTDIAVFRPSQGVWHIRGVGDFSYGQAGDIPVPGDYNGDGKTDIAVWRPSQGYWHIRAVGDFMYGRSGDIPVPGDYNGDKKTDISVYRPADGGWRIRNVGTYAFGWSTDIPVPGDYNGDSKTDVAVFRPSTGAWHIRAVGDFNYGKSGDIPVLSDFNGDGKTDIAVYRPSDGFWHVRAVGDYQYGLSTDIPTVQTLNAKLLKQYGLISSY
ncbi:MAG TPA: VCBS repeat-containing protein [Candidatus Saccharimonadales bacterium]|nr:VCBS repeat-containing protein [Candidatus Saccharimonadales bacterium]